MEILDEPCAFADSFMLAAEQAFVMCTSGDILQIDPTITDIVYQIVSIIQGLYIEDAMQYVPAEYQYIKLLLNLIRPFLIGIVHSEVTMFEVILYLKLIPFSVCTDVCSAVIHHTWDYYIL